MAHSHELLVLAVTRMRAGVCVAGITRAPDGGLRWVRPVKRRGPLLLGDIRCADGALVRAGDVLRWRLDSIAPAPPHIEDALADPVRERPALLRRLAPARRADFCAAHLDRDPAAVLCRGERSLCLLRPDSIRATWTQDRYNGHYEARIAFQASDFITGETGIPATDLAWRALGRALLRDRERLELDDAALRARFGPIYLAVGLGRPFEGRCWPLVVGVHAAGLPAVEIDEQRL